jgi:DNA polymerase III subunit alpha
MNKFLNLHAHSCHSIFDGIAKPLDYAKYISENPDKFYQALSISDHGTLNGMLETFLAAKKYNLKYIPSCEIYMAPTVNDINDTRYHLVLFGINEEGMNQLIRINNEAIKRDQISKSRIGRQYVIVTPDIMKEVIGRDKGNLRCSGACIGGYFNHEILNDRMKNAENRIKELIDIFGVNNVYGEYQTFWDEDEMQKKVNIGVKQLSEKYKIQTIITSDAHALKKEDLQYSAVVRSMSMKMSLTDYINKFGDDIVDSIYYKSAEDFENDLTKHDFGITKEDLEQSIKTTKTIFKAIQSFDLHKKQTFIFGNGNKKENNKLFLSQLSEGWNIKIKDKVPINEQRKYKDRLKHEIGILMQKGFVDYFLAVRRIVLEAEKQGIVRGVGRGSAAGSLVSYLMDITNVDPLKHNLLFDRFINVKRMDFPDIDCLWDETFIRTEFGKKQIKNIVIGDYVYDINNELQKVIATNKRSATEFDVLFKITFELNGEKSFAIMNHKHRLMSENGETMTKNLKYGEQILTDGNEKCVIVDIEIIDKKLNLVDIQVDNSATFQVIPFLC